MVRNSTNARPASTADLRTTVQAMDARLRKLREDYKAMKGAKYSLREFHDAFLRQGYPPVKIVRRALLGNDSPVL